VYVHDTYADITKLNAETGWEPQISFAEGLTQVCTPYK
jgi:UDP-glucose 4-epimerase